MADKEQDILRDAMIETDKEIFGDAFGQESTLLDDTGDRSLEEMGDGLEGQHEPDEDEEEGDEAAETAEAKAKAEADAVEAGKAPKPGETQAEPQGRVPAGRLREQTERTKAAETERDALKARLDAADADRRKEIEALNARFESVLATIRQQPKPADPAKPEVPDLFENPAAFAEYVRNGVKADLAAVQQQMREDRINASMEAAKSVHKETFDKAFSALKDLGATGTPDNRAMVQRIVNSPNPGEAVVSWHKRKETLREVGDDPTAYKARIAEDTRKALMADPEFRKQLIADLRAEAMTGDDGRPRTGTRIPPSLNRTTGGNGRAPNDLDVFDDSPRAMFDSAFT